MALSSSSDGFRRPVTPFAGWTRDERGRLVPLESAPHVGGFAPPGTGKTRMWLAQSAVLWPGPALVSSSKDDLMQMVASRRGGPIALIDLRPITAPCYPNDFAPYRFDPTALISTWDDAKAAAQSLLSTSAVALSGTAFRNGSDPGPWDQLALAPLTCLLYAAGPAATGQGMEWTLEAAENVKQPAKGHYQTTLAPGWASAAAWSCDALYEARVRAVLEMEAKQRDSVKMTVTKVLTAWLLTSRRDRALPALNLSFFDDPAATLYLLTPADGTVAAQAIVLMDQLINRQRTRVAQWEEFSRIGLFLDEVTNTPIPRLPQYLAESRGLGCAICFAAQAGSQLDAIYGPLQGKAIRDVTPAALIMYGSHERDVMESAAFWAGKATRSHQSYGHNADDKHTGRQFGNALEAAELLPRNTREARLIPKGTPGEMVELLDWDEFVKYLDELRNARTRGAAERVRKRASASGKTSVTQPVCGQMRPS
ncbi:type IV secretory system conjugative DNA transfer family protein [Mycobacterium intracellulare]|uniref:type IV secretory system conjugative DNA transfer family protein n=1 Tax=Mycobacterium intracellulare TaxID=1767 RepID=UPI0006CA91E4|nr:TraM recognition domain-containing protein [Mycobacterium intracellulare]KPN47684.1 type IV secretion system protein VirD4 [Mycobacterium intracellulare subsp. chimaera]